MAFDSDKYINEIMNDEFNNSDPETRLRDYFAEVESVQTVEHEGATLFMLNPQQFEQNPDMADIELPEHADKFQQIFGDMMLAMQSQPEMTLAEMTQRGLMNEMTNVGDKAKNALQVAFHASQKLMEKLQIANLASKANQGFSR
ncbi:hypothetical protein GC177_08370 [bacterium]|nr:hypothetical protein [bacterium]